jgi:predicted alpha/beta hydrolase family esterase
MMIWTSPLHFTQQSKTSLRNAFAAQGLRLESVAGVLQTKMKSHTSASPTAASSQDFLSMVAHSFGTRMTAEWAVPSLPTVLGRKMLLIAGAQKGYLPNASKLQIGER